MSLTLATLLIFLLQASGGQENARSCSSSKSGIFSVLRFQLEATPLRTASDFAPIQKSLDFYCFQQEPGAWSVADATAKVFVVARPDDGFVSLVYSPHDPEPFGDAALSALIQKATAIRTQGGNEIALDLPARLTPNRKGFVATIVETLNFSLVSGRWSQTSVTLTWEPAATRK